MQSRSFSTASRFQPAASNRAVRYHPNRVPILITSHEQGRRIQITPCSSNHTAMEIISQSHIAILTCFQSARCHPHRFIYCLAGRLFFSAAPLPFGGTRKNPGYAEFEGTTPDELLSFIISSAYKLYWNARGRAGLDIIVEVVNLILDWHRQGLKDELDELLLKGMKKSGHIEWFGAAAVPRHLANVFETNVEVACIYFTPGRPRIR
ncbi:hypothetical protein BDR26DRAFT_873518 [Obelidium mucronatum]|nr:hypothetical protein BDR26DRAFT_874184 [Obelidium mucronatum]KAI9328777.1 hypothetical protein BDR26DRAFT_873518 [Obelidium mucronatum]